MATEVWITATDGTPVMQVPEDAIVDVSWSDGRRTDPTATLVVNRKHLLNPAVPTSWLVDQFVRAETEIQIIDFAGTADEEVPFWGPILALQHTPNGPTKTVSASGCEYYMGTQLLPTDEPLWSREWLANPDFEDELSDWTIDNPGPVSNNTDQETGSFCIDLDGGNISQDVPFTLSPEFKVRVMARVWIGPLVTNDTVLLRLTSDGTTTVAVRADATASEVTAEEWGWVIRDVILRNPDGGPGVSLNVQIRGSADDTVFVDRVTVQVSAESLGIPGQPPKARFLTQMLAFQSVINATMGDFNISPTAAVTGRVINAPWATRRDVFTSEAVNQLVTAAEGIEWRMEYTTTTRTAAMDDLVGVDHVPSSLTLEAQGAGRNVSVVTGWTQGTEQPVSEWIVMDEEGFIGSYRDVAAFGGVLYQQLSQAPTGTASSELEQRAEKLANEASDPLTDVMTLDVDPDLRGTLHWGDRVWLTFDDGPDSYDGWVRVESRTVNPIAPSFQIEVSRWDEGS